MDRAEQNALLLKWYAEANCYMDNAKETLQKAGKDGSHYTDPKYVQTACGTAYNGVLIALNGWLALKGIPEPHKKQRKSIEYYMSNIAKIDKKLASIMDDAYRILHLYGYYDGIRNVKEIGIGFDAAYEIIDKIKPEQFVPVKETKGQGLKRALNNLLISAAVMFR